MIHTYRCLDRHFVLDVESGSLFETDSVAFALCSRVTSQEYSRGVFCSVAQTDAERECAKELEELGEQGVLLSAPLPIQPHINAGTLKAMCLNISHDCNLRCDYCFAGSNVAQRQHMPLQTAIRSIDFLVEHSGDRRFLEVDFFGGEPLLCWDTVCATVAHARQLERSISKQFRFTLTTNGLALDDQRINYLDREMHNVVISIDGRKSVHNSRRQTRAGGDSFDLILERARRFRAVRGDRNYYIRGTFTSQNLDFAADALALADCGFDQISLEPVVLDSSHPLAIRAEHIPALLDQYELLARAYLQRRRDPKTWFAFFHFNIDLAGGSCKTKRLTGCGAGVEYVAVAPSGQIFPCHQFVGRDEFLLGNVHDDSFDSELSQQFGRVNVFAKPDCAKCWARYYCSGGCVANAVTYAGGMLNTDPVHCALMRKRIECGLAICASEQN